MTDRELIETIEDANSDCISRQGLKESLLSEDYEAHDYCFPCKEIMKRIDEQPSEQPDHIADGDKKDDHFREVTKKVDVISRQAAIDAVNTWFELYVINRTMADTMSVQDMLRELPSAQPEIIRCKDCKHYKFSDNRAFGFPVKRCEWTGFEDVDDDDFCSRAERREG